MARAAPVRARAPARRLRMEYAGGLVKHLGLSMYRGAVPAIAELMANSWDADARHVRVLVPFGQGLDSQTITVTDDGQGMTWEDVQEHYLLIGRDRRAEEGNLTGGGRLVMGRKGLGKLAGFGIARVVEVRTVRNGRLTHFRMDFEEMTRGGRAPLVARYEPTVLADRATDESNGTKVLLHNLLLRRSIVEDLFRSAMARRFSVLGAQFRVEINGTALQPFAPELQVRYQGENGGAEDVEGVGQVRWWIGFTKRPIPQPRARGIAVMVRNRMAQAPFFFDLSGGAHAQAGLEYMTGEVYCDQLDAEQDFVGTDRQGILWDEPMPSVLLKWGEAKIRELLPRWLAMRQGENEKELERSMTGLNETVVARLARLQPAEQVEARRVLRTLASIESVTDEPERASELLDLVLRAFEDSSFFALLRALSETDAAEREEVLRLVTELDIFETVRLAEIARARVKVIQQFRAMIERDVPEKPDLQDFLFDHPWLLDYEFLVVEREKGLERLIIDHFGLDPAAGEDSDKRVDFFCASTRGRYLVVEVKRPSKVIGKAEVVQIIEYVHYLRAQASVGGTPEVQHQRVYTGVLIGHHLSEAGQQWQVTAAKEGILVRTWTELLDVAERTHKEFLSIVTARAPDDVRIRRIAGDEEPKPRPASAPPSSRRAATARAASGPVRSSVERAPIAGSDRKGGSGTTKSKKPKGPTKKPKRGT